MTLATLWEGDMRRSSKRARNALALLTVTIALLIPATAEGGTYPFSLPAEAIQLSAFEAGAHPAFIHLGNGIAATAGVTYPVNAIARAWITLPAGGTFATLNGTTVAGSGNTGSGGMKTNVLIAAPDGRTTTIWNTILRPGYPTYSWTAAPGYGAHAVRLGLRSPRQAACGSCATTLTALTGTIDDNTPPAYVTLSSPLAWGATTRRAIPIGFGLRDELAGPAEIHAFVNGGYAGLLWAAGPPNAARLTHQRTGGSPTAAGASTITLPDADGTHTLQLHGKDAAGNTTGSNTFTVTLDRTPPTLALTAPGGWCATRCVATISASDLTGISRVDATLAGTPLATTPGPGGPGAYAGTIDLNQAGIQGTATLRVTVTDALGHQTQRSATVQLDNTPPLLENVIADPQTRNVQLTIRETSGLDTAVVDVAGTRLELAPTGPAARDTQTYTAAVPGRLGNLDGATALLTATDRLGQTTTQETTFKKRSPTALTATTSRTKLRYRKTTTITGALVAPELPAASTVELRLSHPAWPLFDQVITVIADENGRFTGELTPEHSGTLIAAYAGSADHQPVTATITHVKLKPRIRIKITGKRMRNGLVRRLRVRGTLQPTNHPPLTLLWQAKPNRSKRWVTFCPDNNLITATNGTIRGTCKLKGLHPNNRYRLALRPKPDSLYQRTQSNGRRVRPR